MPDIGQIKGTNIKRGNSGLDPKIFDPNKELLDAMRIIARQEIDKAPRDITKNALVRSVNSDGSVNITLEGKEFNKIPNYTVGTVKENDVVKVTYPQNQASNMYVSGVNKLFVDLNSYSAYIHLGTSWKGEEKTGTIQAEKSGYYLLFTKFHICGASNFVSGGVRYIQINGVGIDDYLGFCCPITTSWDKQNTGVYYIGYLNSGNFEYKVRGELLGSATSDQYGSDVEIILLRFGGEI